MTFSGGGEDSGGTPWSSAFGDVDAMDARGAVGGSGGANGSEEREGFASVDEDRRIVESFPDIFDSEELRIAADVPFVLLLGKLLDGIDDLAVGFFPDGFSAEGVAFAGEDPFVLLEDGLADAEDVDTVELFFEVLDSEGAEFVRDPFVLFGRKLFDFFSGFFDLKFAAE